MSRLSRSARAAALVVSLAAPPALAGVPLTDAQLNAASAGASFSITNRISDQPGVAPVTDPSLVNAWGLSQGPGTMLWVANNGSNTSTIYDPSTFAKNPLTVNVPGAPTGTTFVGVAGKFDLTPGNNNTNTLFAFATEGGQIEGWSPNADLHNAVVKVNDPTAEFKGLTFANVTPPPDQPPPQVPPPQGPPTPKVPMTPPVLPPLYGMAPQPSADAAANKKPRLFAADFGQGTIDVFNSNFKKVGSFTDPSLPPNFAPFNVQRLNGQLYVTFAQKNPGAHDENHGPGLGIVDIFDTSGNLVRRLVTGGKLNAPWGLAIAPQSFGQFAGALLVGNFGDGQINAYDAQTGRFLGKLKDGAANGIDGLWALRSGPNGTITFSAGPNDENHGLVGSIAPASAQMWGGQEVVSMREMHH